jgi:hypothetical protein
MKKALLTLVWVFGMSLVAKGQWSSIVASAVTTNTYTPITGGTAYGSSTGDDQVYANPSTPTSTGGTGIPIGFNFTYAGNTCDVLAINSNGFIYVGNSATASFPASAYVPGGFSSSYTKISGWNHDLKGKGLSTSELRVETIGTAPNRICVVQYADWGYYTTSVGATLNFQIRLNESDNSVDFDYGTCTATYTGTSYRPTIGLGSGSSTLGYLAVSGTTWGAPLSTLTTYLSSNNIPFSATSYPTPGFRIHMGVASNCPVTVTPSVFDGISCGASSVMLGAASSSSSLTPFWSELGSTRIIASGNSFETPVITQNQSYGVRLGAINNTSPSALGGPLSGALTYSTTQVGGNYSNGMSFTATTPFMLDSVTVKADFGIEKFRIVIQKKAGAIYGPGAIFTTEQFSDTITCDASAGPAFFRVPVGLAVDTGEYYIRVSSITGYPGELKHATGGASYPYALGSYGSVDSCRLAYSSGAYAPLYVFYLTDWRVSPMCFGPIDTVTAHFAPVPTNELPYSEPYTSTMPCSWSSTSNSAAAWTHETSSTRWWASGTMDATGYMFVDDDAISSTAQTTAYLTAPEFDDAFGYDTLNLSFDMFLNAQYGGAVVPQVSNDGISWVSLDSINTTTGTLAAPVNKVYDITMYQGNSLMVRIKYDDENQWALGAGIDNFEISGTKATCTSVRFELTTDLFGSEISWSIADINTGIVYASGGPYADFTSATYNPPVNSHYVDTICLPDNGTYEFRIEDSYGDGLTDGSNQGWYQLDILCPWGDNRVATIDTTLVSPYNSSQWGPFHYGSTTNQPMYDSTVFNISCIQYSNVTFQVDMNKVTQSFTTPEVNGFWNNWCGNCNAMGDPDGDNIWTVTLPLEVGSYQEFKYSADGWSIQEMNDPTASCTNGNATYTNRVLTVPASDTTLPVVCWSSCDACSIEVTFNVNMAWEVANGAISADGIHVAGSFQGWSPSTTEMTDPDGDGIYSVTVEMPLDQDLFYKFINGNDWAAAEASGDLAACGVSDGFGGYNRASSVGNADTSLSVVCFTKCYDCAVSIDEALGTINLFPNPTTGAFTMERSELSGNIEVTVIGLQGQMLRHTKWAAGQSELNIDLSDLAAGVYMVRLTAEEGTRTLRVSVQR